MDDLAHRSLNHRKRKQDQADDCTEQASPDPVVSADTLLADPPATPSPDQPRQRWPASATGEALWTSPTSPQVSSPLSSQVINTPYHSSKRPRLDIPPSPSRSPSQARRMVRRSSAHKAFPSKLPTVRSGSDIEDIGIVSTAHPGPSSGSLLRPRANPVATRPPGDLPSLAHPTFPIDLASPHIPSALPPINRQTLKELELEAILRNPVIRHNLLFDPGLQFRPTGSRRKRDLAEKYWASIMQEVDNGCTCVSFDLLGRPHATVCVCTSVPMPTTHPAVVSSPCPNMFTLRMQSRIRNLLTEFLEVLLLVIQPLRNISGVYVNVAKAKTQMQQHSVQAAFIRTLFDPALIEQELSRGLYDMSGLFRTIGTTLKGHCAPMRDSAVESMVHAAQYCVPGGTGTKADAVRSVRTCMEILELMKLDIANHQLQTLRPFLLRTSGEFELKAFKCRPDFNSFQKTQEWLNAAHGAMMVRVHPIPHPLHPPQFLKYTTLSHNKKVYLSVLKGIVDLVFNPFPADFAPTAILTKPLSPSSPTTPTSASSPFSAFPETLHLDHARLLVYTLDANDITAMYMFFLLFRQLVFSSSSESPAQTAPKIDDADMIKLKSEIRDIAATKLWMCLSTHPYEPLIHASGAKYDENDLEKWRNIKQSLILQIARRANDARRTKSSSPPTSPIGDAPDDSSLTLAERWAEVNMRTGSALNLMLHNRIRDAVYDEVVALAFPGPAGNLWTPSAARPQNSPETEGSESRRATGMEPLREEIRSLAQNIARLALIHLNAYLPVYEKPAFMQQ